MNNIEATTGSLLLRPTTIQHDDIVIESSDLLPSTQITSQDEMRRPSRFTFKDMMATTFPKLRYVVEGLLPAGLNMLAGSPKIGKSWLCLDLAFSVASGRPFMGRATDQGNVLYLALEDQPRRLQERLRRVAPGQDLKDLPLEFWTECAAMDEGGLEAIGEWLGRVEKPRLMIVDVWARFEPRKANSKNEYSDITQTMQKIQALIAGYDVAVLLVHHTRKASGDTVFSGDPFDQIIGSRALTSNMDATLMITRARMESDARLDVTGRDIEEASISLTFDKTTCRWNENTKILAPALNYERQQVLDAFSAGYTSAQAIADHVGKNRTTVQNLMKALVDENLLVHPRKGEYHLPLQEAPPAEEPSEPPADMTDLADMGEQFAPDPGVAHHIA